jgi:glycosyltransferase involved in cell wall biosynthesis
MNLTNKVTFLGYVENALNYVKACDVFVQSSIDEAFGVSILEALLLEKPIAVTTPAGVIEFVSRSHEFLPSGNPQALGEKIISQINSIENSCEVCKKKQMEYLNENFDFTRTSQAYANVYRELISK